MVSDGKMSKLTVLTLLLCLNALNALSVSKDVAKDGILNGPVIRPLPIEIPEIPEEVQPEEEADPCSIDGDFLQPVLPPGEVETVPEEEQDVVEGGEGDGILVIPNPEDPLVPETLPIITDPVDPDSDVIYAPDGPLIPDTLPIITGPVDPDSDVEYAPEGEEVPLYVDENGHVVLPGGIVEEGDIVCDNPEDYLKPTPR